MKEAEFTKRVRAVDEEAGQKLHNMIKEAKQSTEYAEKIRYCRDAFNERTAADCILWGFSWEHTSEGNPYWRYLFDILDLYNI